MAHPSGAGYTRTPKFIERMKHAEGGSCTPYRADGGQMPDTKPALSPHGFVEEGYGDDPTQMNKLRPTSASTINAPTRNVTTTVDPSTGRTMYHGLKRGGRARHKGD